MRPTGSTVISSDLTGIVITLLLMMSGDVERNPGPVKKGDKPAMNQIQYMSYNDEDGKKKHFRLLDRIQPLWKNVARALHFPEYSVRIAAGKGDEAADWILGEWLRGANKEEDDRPITWGTLLTALEEATMGEEVETLNKYLIRVPNTERYQKEPSLKDLMNMVAVPVQDRWERVGEQLDIPDYELTAISRKQHGDALSCCREIFTKWKNRMTCPYTWETIIHVLETPAVDKADLAKKLRDADL